MADILISGVNASEGIPLLVRTVTETNWTQFYMNLAVALLGSIFLLWIFADKITGNVASQVLKFRLRAFKKVTGRHLLMIKHTQGGLFDMSMISQQTLKDITRALERFEGKPFDLVLHTPGGEVFSGMFISRLLKNYPSNVRAVIPMYAMSGGTILALSCNEIYMNDTACLGPVDPQLGSLFKFGSARSWDKIIKFKGKKADDSSISLAYTGEQYTKSIRNHVNQLLNDKLDEKQANIFSEFITSGEVEHAYPLTPTDLAKFGLKINKLDKELSQRLIKIISSRNYEGVTFV